jgi:hypothetical protein
LPLKLTRWKRLFEEQEGKARHLVAAPLLYFSFRWIFGEITRLSTWPDGFDSRTEHHSFWGMRKSAASPCKQGSPGAVPGCSTTVQQGISSVGRTSHFDCECRTFEPCIPRHTITLLHWRISSAVEHRIVYPAMRRQLVPASLAQSVDALPSKRRFLSVRIRGDAPPCFLSPWCKR